MVLLVQNIVVSRKVERPKNTCTDSDISGTIDLRQSIYNLNLHQHQLVISLELQSVVLYTTSDLIYIAYIFLSYQTGWEHIPIFYDSMNGRKERNGITTIFFYKEASMLDVKYISQE